MKTRASCTSVRTTSVRTTSVRTWIAGLAGALSLVGVAMPTMADDNPPTHQPVLQPIPALEPYVDPDAKTSPTSASVPRRTLRGAPPPAPGGGCQPSGPFKNTSATADTNGILIAVTNTATNAIRMDNFKVAGTGSQSLTSVSWAGWFTSGAPVVSPSYAAPIAGNSLPSGFIITVFTMNASANPVQVGPSQQVIRVPGSTPAPGEMVEAMDASDVVPSGNATGVLTFPVMNYTAVLPTAVSLNGGECYFLEIRPIPVGSAATPATLVWNWRCSSQGDGLYLRRTALAAPPADLPQWRGIGSADFSFCVNVPTVSVADGNSCGVGTIMSCASAANFYGQLWDGSGNGNGSSQVDVFLCADNFTTTCPMTINNVCWYGTYGTGPAFPFPATDSFRIRVYPDAGGANSGAPAPTHIAERFVTTAGTPDGNVARSSNTFNQFAVFGTNATFTGFSGFSFNGNLSANPIVLPASGCYWLEIAQTTTQAGGVFYVWMPKNNGRTTTKADAYRLQVGTPFIYDPGSAPTANDFVWAFNTVLPSTVVRSTTCLPAPAIPNNVCSASVVLTLNAPSPVFSNNIITNPTTAQLPPGCNDDYPNRNGGWYRIVGTGQDVTVSTCNTGTDPAAPQTNFDTVIGVYCSSGVLTPNNTCNTSTFTCIASNDDAPTAGCSITGSSSVTFPTNLGQQYYIYVWGFQGAQGGLVSRGYYYVNAVTGGASVGAPTCGSIANCRIDIPSGSQPENEVCGTAGPNGVCTDPETLALNQWANGTVFGNNNTRDFDFWHLPDAGSVTTDGGNWYTIDLRAELPLNFVWFRSQCVDGATSNGVITTLPQCTDGQTFNIFVPAGGLYIRIEPSGTFSLPCDPTGLGRGNRYVFRVRQAPLGACCVTGSLCAVTVARDGAGLASDPQDCSQRAGVYLGDGTTCSGPDNLPCDVGGGVVAGTTTGSCCNNYGICYTSSDAALTCTDGVFTAMGTCTAPTVAGNPFTCTAAPASAAQRCCLPSGVCIVIPQPDCTTQGGVSSAVAVCIPNSCPQQTLRPCCSAAGVCVLSIQADCPTSQPGWSWSTTGISCSPNPCPATQVCCTSAGNCTLLVPAACIAAGGTTPGGTTCTGVTCPQPTEVCCLPNGGCTVMPIGSTTCSGTIQAGSTCPPTPTCPQPTEVCCQTNGVCVVIPIGSTTCNGTIVTTTGTCPPTPACTQPTTCCFADGSCTIVLVGDSCTGGTANAAATCTLANCPQPVVCCRGATCTQEFNTTCTSGSGGVIANGTTCSTTPDSCLVACCTTSGCITVTPAACATAGGFASTAGLGSACTVSTDCTFVACCFCASSNCSLIPAANCTAQNGIPQPVGTVCGSTVATNPCAQPIACCQPDGTCTVVPAGQTCAAGSTDSGSSACPPAVPCAQPTTCCFPDGTCAVVLVGGTCVGGTVGTGSVCGPAALCPQPTTCCLPDGSCAVVLVGGTCNGTVGGGSTCPPATPCPQPTVCCLADGSCTLVNVGATCAGTPRPDTVCPPSPACPPPAQDNCCRGTTCNPVSAGTCTGVVAGSNSLVRPSCGPGTAFATCCYADFNHDGTQSIDDLFLYFNAYFTTSPWSDFGGDGVSQPTIDDLFLYINAYFGTCS